MSPSHPISPHQSPGLALDHESLLTITDTATTTAAAALEALREEGGSPALDALDHEPGVDRVADVDLAPELQALAQVEGARKARTDDGREERGAQEAGNDSSGAGRPRGVDRIRVSRQTDEGVDVALGELSSLLVDLPNADKIAAPRARRATRAMPPQAESSEHRESTQIDHPRALGVLILRSRSLSWRSDSSSVVPPQRKNGSLSSKA